MTDAFEELPTEATDFAKETAQRIVDEVNGTGTKAANLAADTRKTLSDNVADFSKRLQGVSSFHQQTVNALAKSSEIAAKAFEGIGTEVAAYSKSSFEERLAAVQDLATARTLPELLQKQTEFARHAFEGWMQQASKMNEIYAAAAKDIAAPISERFSAATEELRA